MLAPAPDATLGSWAVGDIAAGPFAVPYVDDKGEPVDLNGSVLDDVVVVAPDRQEHDAVGSIDEDGMLSVLFPAIEFGIPGEWAMVARFTFDDNRVAAEPLPFVVEARDGWVTMAAIRSGWRDAPSNDSVLFRLLEVARLQVEEFAPQPVPDPPSSNLVSAQYAQARNIWNAVKSDPSNFGIGEEPFVIRPFPLDWTVKQMIRPRQGRPVVA